MELGKQIISLRKEHNMTQEDFAEVCNVTRQTVSNWENGRNYPDLEILVFISDHFDISLDILLKGDRKMVSKITNEQKMSKYNTIAIIVIVVLIIGEVLLGNIRVAASPDEYEVGVAKIEMSDFETETSTNEGGNTIRMVNIGKTDVSEAFSMSIDEELYNEFKRNGGGYCVIVRTNVTSMGGVISDVAKGDRENTLCLYTDQSLKNKILSSLTKGTTMNYPCLTTEDFDFIYDNKLAKSDGIDKAIVWKSDIKSKSK